MSLTRPELMEFTQLPSSGFSGRWTPSVKAGVCRAIAVGQITIAEAMDRWPGLSVEEIASWMERWRSGGNADLRVKQTQVLRQHQTRRPLPCREYDTIKSVSGISLPRLRSVGGDHG